ncbi:MAG: hypothetical protein BWX88_04592 [Planctomycetes bacterium ADurb.Bin126]|nr:MAG: hypothetical protein BWX88_04592 [Planctomycetes bacterium ADurb.Bin126]
MQKTMNIDGQKITVRVRRRHSRGNPIGWIAKIDKATYYFNVLGPQEAIDKAVAKYRAAIGAQANERVVAQPDAGLSDRIAKHAMYSPSDLAYFRRKGYSDEEILAFWDRDNAMGCKPCHHATPPDVVGMLAHLTDHGADVQAAIEQIAREHLGIETLTERKRDALDFHEMSLGQIKAALHAAFELGRRAAGQKSSE